MSFFLRKKTGMEFLSIPESVHPVFCILGGALLFPRSCFFSHITAEKGNDCHFYPYVAHLSQKRLRQIVFLVVFVGNIV